VLRSEHAFCRPCFPELPQLVLGKVVEVRFLEVVELRQLLEEKQYYVLVRGYGRRPTRCQYSVSRSKLGRDPLDGCEEFEKDALGAWVVVQLKLPVVKEDVGLTAFAAIGENFRALGALFDGRHSDRFTALELLKSAIWWEDAWLIRARD